MKLLLYCTKAKPYLRDYRGKAIYNRFVISPTDRPFTSDDTQPILNGKIVAECDFEVEDLRIVDDDPLGAYWYETKTLSENEVLEKSCLTSDELYEYLGEYNDGYAIHIKNLHIFDEPKEFCGKFIPSIKYVYTYDNNEKDTIGISISPQELCKILNGEKTIEVRKKVLKEMLR